MVAPVERASSSIASAISIRARSRTIATRSFSWMFRHTRTAFRDPGASSARTTRRNLTETGMTRLDLLPRQVRIDLFQSCAHPATPAHRRRLFGPATAARRARLHVVMAREAQHHQVGLGVVAALQD